MEIILLINFKNRQTTQENSEFILLLEPDIYHDFNLPAYLSRGRHIIFRVRQIAGESPSKPNTASGVKPSHISSSLHINPLVL